MSAVAEIDTRTGLPVHAQPTGRRRAWNGKLHCEMRRGEQVFWPFCRPHVDCAACTVGSDHDDCPTSAP